VKPATALLFVAATLASCVGLTPQRIIVPESGVETAFGDWLDPLDEWRIADSRDGPGIAYLPQWVRFFYESDVRLVEQTARFDGRYVFVARNQGSNFAALRQWADNFSPEHDLARLVVHRAERRFVTGAALYPDDEYGGFFMAAIRGIADGEYPGAVKEDVFWVRRELVAPVPDDALYGVPQSGIVVERFEFLVLVSVDARTLGERILKTMDEAGRGIRPTREQAAAIANIRQNFFEGF